MAAANRPTAWTDDDTRAVTSLMLAVVAIRLATALLAFFANVSFPLDQREQFTVLGDTHYFWDTFARYDSGWYHGIASRGYAWAPGGRSNIAFFPAYPLLMGALGRLLGGTQGDFYFAGIVISWLCAIGAVAFVYRVARLDLPASQAWHAVLLTYLFPFAFFFGVVYSEGVFLLTLSAAIWGLRTRRWWLGALAGAVMTATRVNGVMAVPALVWIAWRSAGKERGDRATALAAGLATGAGFLAFCLYTWRVSGDPFEWYGAITRWGYYPGTALASNPLVQFVANLALRPYQYLVNERGAPYDVLNGFFPVLMAVTLPLLWRRLGAGYALLIAANLALPLSSGQFEGLGRYCAVLFPFQIWVASVLAERWRPLVYAAYGVLYAVALTMFTTLHTLY